MARKQGHSKLVYDKATGTIQTVDPYPPDEDSWSWADYEAEHGARPAKSSGKGTIPPERDAGRRDAASPEAPAAETVVPPPARSNSDSSVVLAAPCAVGIEGRPAERDGSPPADDYIADGLRPYAERRGVALEQLVCDLLKVELEGELIDVTLDGRDPTAEPVLDETGFSSGAG